MNMYFYTYTRICIIYNIITKSIVWKRVDVGMMIMSNNTKFGINVRKKLRMKA